MSELVDFSEYGRRHERPWNHAGAAFAVPSLDELMRIKSLVERSLHGPIFNLDQCRVYDPSCAGFLEKRAARNTAVREEPVLLHVGRGFWKNDALKAEIFKRNMVEGSDYDDILPEADAVLLRVAFDPSWRKSNLMLGFFGSMWCIGEFEQIQRSNRLCVDFVVRGAGTGLSQMRALEMMRWPDFSALAGGSQ